ncbi:MAG: hypothetical protein JRI68_20170 [Deltaproteobacteria bacterium]|nr:hypothetical protein [Deltaproteobacteria bacterium]
MDDKQTKVGALLLWGLMGTGDDDLAKFRRQRIGRKSELDLEHLKRVRAMLRALVEAIRSDDEDRWEQVREAAAHLPEPTPEVRSPAEEDAKVASEPDDQLAPSTSGDQEPPDRQPHPVARPVPARHAKPGRPILPPVIAPLSPPTKPSPWAASGEPEERDSEPEAETSEDETALLPIDDLLAAQKRRRAGPAWLDTTLDPDAPEAEGRDPHDPEAETVKLRAHVMPFMRRTPPTEPPPGEEARAAAGAPSPPEQVSEVEAAELPVTEGLQRYAEFCAACAAEPGRGAEIRAEYGVVGEEAHETLDLTWNERFADDPRLLERWEQLFEKTLARLRDEQE